MVNDYIKAEPGLPTDTTAVMNPTAELIIDLYGTDTGSRPRPHRIGVAAVPSISAEVEITAEP